MVDRQMRDTKWRCVINHATTIDKGERVLFLQAQAVQIEKRNTQQRLNQLVVWQLLAKRAIELRRS